MEVLSKPCPMFFCGEFTKQEFSYLKKNKVWNSWHPVMERLLSRSVEMKPVYVEICNKFWYSSDCCSPELKLTLEAIWASGKLYNKDTISHKRKVQKELSQLHRDIPRLTSDYGVKP